MSLVDQEFVEKSKSFSAALYPSVARAEEIDQMLRARLARSLDYLGDVVALGDANRSKLASVLTRLRGGAVSPFVFCLYSKLVAELAEASQVDRGAAFKDIILSAAAPARVGVIALADPAHADSWWNQIQTVLDTDRRRPFHPKPPQADDLSRCTNDISQALALLQRTNPACFDEVHSLLRMIVLASPASDAPADGFNGASSFFLWGAAVLNATIKRTPIAMIDVLVHESSHGLLFGLSAEGPLMRNGGDERYASPVRKDQRPLEGIFHACFVTTRVHAALSHMLRQGDLGDDWKREAVEHSERNALAARSALDLVERHMQPTGTGARILAKLSAYWAGRPH
jgi:HEXXH motif-containing protein